MNIRSLFAVILTLFMAGGARAQRPPQPGGGPGMPGGPGYGAGEMGRQGPRGGDWLKRLDANKNGALENDELQSAIDKTFAEIDRDGNGVIDGDEAPMGPPQMGGGPERGFQGPPDGRIGGPPRPERGTERDGDDNRLLPPFFFERRLREGATTRQQFAEAVRGVFNEMDTDHNGSLSREEARPPRHDGYHDGGPGAPPPPPNAQFIGAELRFGDKLVEGHPFSADTVIEDTRRLYDGTTVTRTVSGAIYRNTAGSTRREQPLEMIGGVQVGGADGKPQILVFINDFASKTQTFLDANNKTARTHPIGDGPRPDGPGPGAHKGEKSESLGTQTIEGVKVEGTRITFEIPAGHLGNDKPIEVVTENWFSPELGVMVMSRHIDPIAGEHVFRLTNIKLGEPSADLFTVPQGYRVENGVGRRPHEE